MVISKKWMTISERDGFTVLDLGVMEIWDGADMALMRDALNELVLDQKRRTIAINMQYVKYIPSGFFGMLYDLNDQGIAVRLLAPQPNVKNMLWFRRFFQWERGEWYALIDQNDAPPLLDGDAWDADDLSDDSGLAADEPESECNTGKSSR